MVFCCIWELPLPLLLSHADAAHHELQSPVPRTVWEGPVQVCSLARMSCLEGQVTSTALYMQLVRPDVY